MTEAGVLLIDSRVHRSQADNREDARARLMDLLRRAAVAPKKRRPTRPRPAARERRLTVKKRTATLKANRSRARRSDEDT
jgi:ribosome-associated protein